MRISVALCTYNGERYLRDQLDSVLAQERLPDELVACDDGSSDATLEILDAFAERAPFEVRIQRNADNLGATKNFEQAMSLCRGDAIALCDQDDVWKPAKLARAAEALADDPDVGITFSDAELIDETGAPVSGRLWESVRFTEELRSLVARDGLLPWVMRQDIVTGATMTLRAPLRDLVCPIPVEWHHDAWASLVCSFVSGHRSFDEPLLSYRVHHRQEVGVYAGPDELGRPGPRGPGGLGGLILPEERGSRDGRPRGEERRRLLRELARRNQDVADWFNLAARRAGQTRPLRHPAAEELLARIEGRARHYRVRGELPDDHLRRAPAILREWWRGGYHRRPRGARGALRDLVS